MSKNIYFYILIFLSLVIIGCEQPINEPDNGTSIVSINLGLVSGDIIKASAPPDISMIDSIELRVSGPGMSTITKSYAPNTSSIIVEVPSGDNRTFELTFYLLPDSPSAVLTWQGSASADCPPDEIVSVSMSMSVARTKLLIPDRLNNSIVMINDMTGSYWKRRGYIELNLVSLSEWTFDNFYPADIDIDSSGDIYIANDEAEQFGAVVKLNDIDDTEPEIVMNYVGPTTSVAVDSINNYLYCASSNTLYRKDLSDPSDTGSAISISDFGTSETISGIAIADNGEVFISCNLDYELYQISVTDNTGTIIGTYSSSYFVTNSARDILVKDTYIYICYDYPGVLADPQKQIVRLPLVDDIDTLQESDEITFGTASDFELPDEIGELNGPNGFIKGVYEGLCFIDESSSGGNDRLVFIYNIITSNWDLFGSTGTGDNQFQFDIDVS